MIRILLLIAVIFLISLLLSRFIFIPIYEIIIESIRGIKDGVKKVNKEDKNEASKK